jgi:outer membrane protein TolC
MIPTIGAWTALVGVLAAQDGSKLTVDLAAQLAEQRAYSVLIQRSAITRQRERLSEAKAGFNVRAGVQATYQRNDEQVVATLGPGAPPVILQPFDTGVVVANVTLPLDISGSLRKQVDAQRNSLNAETLNLLGTLNDVRFTTKTAYLGVLRAKAQLAVADQALALSKARRDQAKLQFEQAAVAKIDVTRFEAQVAQSEAERLAAQNNYQNAINQFNEVLARPIETESEFGDVVTLPELPSDRDQLVLQARKERPESRSLFESIRGLGNVVRAQETGDDPSLNLSINHTRNLVTTPFNPREFQTVGQLVLSIPIFDQGLTRQRVKQARQDELQAQLRLQQLHLNISQEIRSALNNMATAKARLQSAEQQIRLAEEVFRIAGVRRDAGEGTYVEVIDAINTLTQARNNGIAARYDYLNGYYQLQRAMGRDNFQEPAS